MAESTNNMEKLTIVVGAGEDYSCRFDNEQHHYFLIDARREAVERLQQTYADEPRVQIKQALISGKAHLITFYRYSLPEFSSTLKPDALTHLLPGLAIKGDEEVRAESLAELISEAAGAKFIELTLNVPGQELSMLSSLSSETLLKLDSLIAVTQSSKLYQNGNTASELSDWLFDQNFDKNHETDQAFSLVTQDWSIDKKALRIAQLERERDDAVARASDAEKERDEAVARASGTSQELEQIKRERDDAVAQASSKSKELEDCKKNCEQLTTTIETLGKTFADSQTQLLQKIDRLMTSQERQTKRLETSLSLNQFWQTGEYLELGRGENLGPQLKQFLLQKLSQEHYDVIIQFGISECTLFIASVIDKLKGTRARLTSTKGDKTLGYKSRTESVSNEVDNCEKDLVDTSLPAEVCVFEHNLSRLKKLEHNANQRQLSHLLSTKHAPLVDYTYNGRDYLHYDSDDSLAQLKELLDGRTGKILIFVSGPSTRTDCHDRFPAGPKILNSLSKHEIHFVTDNYYDKNAKDVAVLWSSLFDERGLSIEKQLIADEKPGFAWLLNR